MTARKLTILRAVIAGATAVVAAWSVATANPFPLFIAVIIAIILLISFNRAVHEVTKDERTVLLYARASRAALATVLPLTALVAVILILLRDRLPHDIVMAAYTLSYAITVLMAVQAAFYYYYNRKS